ncbi:unnamed protein product [Sphenostylis stenocarpa]|uniref:RABX5 catalytic core helical domain-containing protein n=1 Tax=Sphenostylis stenocarpa TaxID=92480 RepID=A0AA86SKW9_9FABA|nr:unnamed protein product [Sphenostylis stenocarpa]
MDTANTISNSLELGFYDQKHGHSHGVKINVFLFIVSFSFYQPKPENDGNKVQDFFLFMEAAIRDHPLWTTASEQDIDCAMEGLEKYIMIKLFSRTFSASAEDSKIDNEISEKICLLQTFLKPEHLDIPPTLQNEASWLDKHSIFAKKTEFKLQELIQFQNLDKHPSAVLQIRTEKKREKTEKKHVRRMYCTSIILRFR